MLFKITAGADVVREKRFGDESFVISSDFPHADSDFPDAGKHFMQVPRVSEDSKRKILWDNCARRRPDEGEGR